MKEYYCLVRLCDDINPLVIGVALTDGWLEFDTYEDCGGYIP